jgi:hypothetical protein
MDFTFRAPAFFDATATAAECNTVYHDAPGTGERLAKIKRERSIARILRASDAVSALRADP